MTRESLSVVAGLAVMVSGLVVFSSMAGEPQTEQVPESTPPVSAPAVEVPAEPVVETPELPGVPSVVQRVLLDEGSAESVSLDQLTGVPAEVARVLVAYEAPLRVPTSTEVGNQP